MLRRVLLPLSALLAACSGATEPSPVPEPTIVDDQRRVPALTCPGDPSCPAAAGDLRVGAAVRDISPTLEPFTDENDNARWDEGEPFEDLDGDGAYTPVWIAGFGLGRPANDLHDPIWARAIVFEQGDLQVGILVFDFVGWFHDDAIRVRTAALAAGLPFDHLVVASTHNHEGPDTMGPWGPNAGATGRNAAYEDRAVAAAIEALAEAWAARAPASLTWAQADFPDLVHDSRLPEIKDPTATLARFDGADGDPIATLTVWGNHPEALGGSQKSVTSDYPHHLRTALEAAYPGAPAIFLAGNLGGLMNPLHVVGCPDAEGNATCDTGTQEKAAYIGEGVARGLLAAIEGPGARTEATPELRARRRPVFLRPANLLFLTGWAAGLFERALFDPERTYLSRARAEAVPLEEVQQGAVQLQTEVGAVGIGALELVTVPGELYPELWLTGPDGESLIAFPDGRDFPDATAEPPLSTLVPAPYVPVIVNQANDSLGYLIPKAQFDREAPRAYRDNGQYGEVNSIGPDAPGDLAAAIAEMYR